MEKWEEVFVGQIEKDQYLLECLSGESKGLQLILEGIKKKNRILVDFGAVSAYRLIDEGILCWTHFDELAAEKFAKDHFQNVIYQVENGEFSSFIKKIADELFSWIIHGSNI